MHNYQQRKFFTQIIRYFTHHLHTGFRSLGQFSRAPFNSFMTCLVIGIALALPTSLFILLKNAEVLTQHLHQTAQFTLYLKNEIGAEEAIKLERLLQKNPAIETVRAISPQEGLMELQQQAGIEGLFKEFQDNPLPFTLVVTPTTQAAVQIDVLSAQLKNLPEVDSVMLDSEWIKKLFTLIQLAHHTACAFAIFLGIAVLLIVNNTIRGAMQHHQAEIEVIQLLGGTHPFIRRPFLYIGMIYGLLGAIIAWQLADLLFLYIKTPIQHLAQLYNSNFQLVTLGLNETLILLACSIALGWIGSWAAVSRHLRA